MSLLLALFSIGLAGQMVKEVASELNKAPIKREIAEDEKNGNFDVVKNFESILKICGVKRKAHGNSSVKVLPYHGYEKCYQYLEDHHLVTRADKKRFVEHYKTVLASELSQRQADYDRHYYDLESKIKAMMETDEFEIVRFTYFDVFMAKEDVEAKVNDLCAHTFLGDFLVGQVKVKEETSQSFTEIWALKIPVSMKYSLKQYYGACANKCGYIK